VSNTLKLGLSLSFPVLYLNALGVLGVLFDYSVDWSIHYVVVVVMFVLFMAETLSGAVNTDPPSATLSSRIALVIFRSSNMVITPTLVAFSILSAMAGVVHVLGTPLDNPSLLSYALGGIAYLYFEGWRNFWEKLPFSVVWVLIVVIMIEGAAGVLVYLNSVTLLLLLFLSVVTGYLLVNDGSTIEDLLDLRVR